MYVGGVLVTVAETTAIVAQQKAETIATETEERFHVALEAANLGTWYLDLTTDTAAVPSLRHDQIGYQMHQAERDQKFRRAACAIGRLHDHLGSIYMR